MSASQPAGAKPTPNARPRPPVEAALGEELRARRRAPGVAQLLGVELGRGAVCAATQPLPLAPLVAPAGRAAPSS